MKKRVVVTDFTFPNLRHEQLAAERAGAEFIAFQCSSEEQVVDAVQNADVAVVQFAPMTAAAISGLKKGAAILRYGIGYDNIDIEAADRGEHPVGYVPDYCPDEVADHTAASLLALLRKLPQLNQSVQEGKWAAVEVAKPIKPFNETLVGFYGFGRIAQAVMSRLRAFGFKFAAADPYLGEADASTKQVTKMRPEELFSHCDAICLHAPSTEETHEFVNTSLIASMKAHAVIVNTARGSLINEEALASALRERTIAGAALDVFQTEPLPETSPLRGIPNLLVSPHAAWYSDAAIERLQDLIAQDIENHLAGKALRKPVPGSGLFSRMST